MKPTQKTRASLCFWVMAICFLANRSPASANKLSVYYDPDTGNVSFDTSETRTGGFISYQLRLYPNKTSLRLIPESHINLFSSALRYSSETRIEETTLGTPLSGLFTIGNILPTGIARETWEALFPQRSTPYYVEEYQGKLVYTSGLGFPADDPIEYFYGHPGREFDNRWDLIDPDLINWAESARLIYRQGSGELLIDTRGDNGGYISGFKLESNDNFLEGRFTPPWDSPHQVENSSRLFILGDAVEPAIMSLGEVLPAGLLYNELLTQLTTTQFFGQAGIGLFDLDLEVEGQSFSIAYIAVPEPASLAYAMIVMACFTYRRQHLKN